MQKVYSTLWLAYYSHILYGIAIDIQQSYG